MATFTDKAMQARPGPRDVWLTHSMKRGAGALVGRITPSGERLFYFRHTDSSGQRRQLVIGPYHPKGSGGLTLAQAFDRAADLSKLYREGVRDLAEHFDRLAEDRRQASEAERLDREEAQRRAAEEARAAARRLTVRALFDAWQRAELSPLIQADGTRTGRKDGGEWVRKAFERRLFPALGEVLAEDVKRAELLAIIDAAKAGGTLRTAQVLLADMRQMFRFAAEREIVVRNPLDGIKAAKAVGKATERDRVLSETEISELARALPTSGMAPRSMLALWLILATGTRIGECMGAVWNATDLNRSELARMAEEADVKLGFIDLDAKTWHLPTTKNEREHTIHLSEFALTRLEDLFKLRELNDDGELIPWVFPSTDRTGPVCVKSLGKQLSDRQREPSRRMSGRAKATSALVLSGGRWTAHDLRRTAGTCMARLGVSTDVIDECLNHKLASKVARIYIRDRREADQRQAFDTLGRLLTRLIDPAVAKAGKHVAKSVQPSLNRATSGASRPAPQSSSSRQTPARRSSQSHTKE